MEQEGSGFQIPTSTSIRLFEPSLVGMPTFSDIIRDKYYFATRRWLQGKDHAGFNQFSMDDENNGIFIVYGWVGQAAAPGYAFQVLKDQINDPAALSMAQKSLDFLSGADFYKEGFYTWYNVKTGKWQERIWRPDPEYLSQGQGMFNMANAIRVGRQNSMNVSSWELFLKKACDFHSDRILDTDWNPESTSEGFFIAPLCRAAILFKNEKYKNAAIKAGAVLSNRHLNMREPYWGGTLDASCEDKEGSWAAFQGFLELYELTREEKYLKWAKHAGDVTLTYTVLWDIDMPAGRLRDHFFESRGWTAVSVQNMHIDVYGVLIAPYVYKLGLYLEDKYLKNLGLLMYRSCGQLIDPYGSQGEQLQQTNYNQSGSIVNDYRSFRGGYVENWTVFWITAHFLNAAAQFKEMGVPIN